MQPYYEEKGITIFNGDCRALTLPEKPALVLIDTGATLEDLPLFAQEA